MYTPASTYPISAGLRIAEIIFALLVFILGCVATAKVSFNKAFPAMGIISGIFSMAFYIPLLIPATIPYFTPAIALGGEIFTWIWWLIAMATSATKFGGANCSAFTVNGFFFVSGTSVGCQTGKALLAFAVLGWVLSIITLVLQIIYSIVPAGGANAWNARNYFVVGGIFPLMVPRTEPTGVVDPEAAVGVRSAESGEEIKTTAETDMGTHNELEYKLQGDEGVGGGFADSGVTAPYPADSRI